MSTHLANAMQRQKDRHPYLDLVELLAGLDIVLYSIRLRNGLVHGRHILQVVVSIDKQNVVLQRKGENELLWE